MQQLRAQFNELTAGIPAPILKFIVRALVLFVIYEAIMWMWPQISNTIDPILSLWTAQGSAFILSLVGFESVASVTDAGAIIISYQNVPYLSIAGGCNGWALFMMWIWLVISYPAGDLMKKILIMVSGIGAIFILNLVRIMLLMFTQLYAPQYMDFNHHYVFKIAIYAAIFAMWAAWIKRSLPPTYDDNDTAAKAS